LSSRRILSGVAATAGWATASKPSQKPRLEY
jgi:hypothetical protein